MSRGLGRWQQVILNALTETPGMLLRALLEQECGQAPTRAEYSVLYRAATLLAKQGQCVVERVWTRNTHGYRTAMVWVGLPGEPVPNLARTAYEKRLGIQPPSLLSAPLHR